MRPLNPPPLRDEPGTKAWLDWFRDLQNGQPNFDMEFEFVSNTQIKINVRGTDGVTRSVSLTLS